MLQDELLCGQRQEERGWPGNPRPAGSQFSLASTGDAATYEAAAHRQGRLHLENLCYLLYGGARVLQ